MRKIFLLTIMFVFLSAFISYAQTPLTINGAGATFPQPIYTKWAHKYAELTKTQINYQGIGSGGGIAQIKAKTVDFGATDEPLNPEEMQSLGIFQFPTVMGGVVPIINLKGVPVEQLVLNGPTLADIFLGKITKWNDPAITKLNPKLNLPAKNITIIHRSDGSGTTFIFTSYLATVSADWKAKVGAGKAVKWPAPNSVGAKGNPGVAGQVQQIDGAIGYVEFAYALQNKIPSASLINKDGKIVKPDMDSFQAAAANADWEKAPPGFSLMLINQPGEKSWPIVGLTWILLYKDQPDPAKGKAILAFFDWCFKHGADLAKELHYVTLPPNVVATVQAAWAKDLKAGGKPLWP